MEKPFDESYFWRGDKVVLRQSLATDVPAKVSEYYDSEARRLLQQGVSDLPPISHEAFSKLYLGDEKPNDRDICSKLSFAVDNLQGDYVGWIHIHSREPRHGRFEIGGISIFKQHRRKGYASDALGILLRYGFFELRMQKCNSSCMASNIPSRRLHERLGFVEEGQRRRHVFTDNQYDDLVLYGLLKEEFEKLCGS